MSFNEIKKVNHLKYLGITFDKNLTWKQHIINQHTKVSRGLWALANLRPCVIEQTLKNVYHSLVQSHVQYCVSIWGNAPKSTLHSLQML